MASESARDGQRMSHTPGPWAFDGPISNIHVYEAERPHMRVCFMTSDGRPRENARLITAAPDMLALLQFILSGIERGKVQDQAILRRNEEEIETETLSARIRAAIAKATV